MGGTLRVDPAKLRTAAQAQADVGTFVSSMATGQLMMSATGSGSGLHSEAACQFAGTMFDTVASTVHEELTAHSTNLSSAADQYLRVDDEYARRLRKFTQ
jgi:hypothetical protein